jgi:hypothetical protein
LAEHLQHLIEVLSILGANSLTTKKSKCTFATPQVEYLGHNINADGVAKNPAKIASIQSWATPTSVIQLRSFLCLIGYYRRFIKNYGLIYRPLHDLLKKDSFAWTDNHTQALRLLKSSMTASPVLALPNFSLPFMLETDASGTGLEAMLMQHGRPIAFYNQSLGPKSSA